MIVVDLSEMKDELGDFSEFLKSKIRASIVVNGESLVLDTGEEKLLTKRVKTLVKKFLHQRGLAEAYKVIEAKEVVRVAKRKHGEKRKAAKKRTAPSPYDTLPYFFPNRP